MSVPSKIKGFFRGTGGSSPTKHLALQRGETIDVNDFRNWYSAPSFRNLDTKGQEAFFRFLRGHKYSEDLDIASVPVTAEGMDMDAKRYQFWVKCDKQDLGNLFDVYIIDDETKLADVDETYTERDAIKTKAEQVDNYIETLKDRMEASLNGKFAKFKEYLAREEAKSKSS